MTNLMQGHATCHALRCEPCGMRVAHVCRYLLTSTCHSLTVARAHRAVPHWFGSAMVNEQPSTMPVPGGMKYCAHACFSWQTHDTTCAAPACALALWKELPPCKTACYGNGKELAFCWPFFPQCAARQRASSPRRRPEPMQQCRCSLMHALSFSFMRAHRLVRNDGRPRLRPHAKMTRFGLPMLHTTPSAPPSRNP